MKLIQGGGEQRGFMQLVNMQTNTATDVTVGTGVWSIPFLPNADGIGLVCITPDRYEVFLYLDPASARGIAKDLIKVADQFDEGVD